jgi:hypothetical protein
MGYVVQKGRFQSVVLFGSLLGGDEVLLDLFLRGDISESATEFQFACFGVQIGIYRYFGPDIGAIFTRLPIDL